MIKNKKMMVLLSLCLLAIAGGMAGQYFYPNDPFPASDIPVLLVGTFLTFVWYSFDTDEFNYPRSLWLNLGVIAVGIIALPYYFFRTRGLKGGLLATLVFLLLIVGWGLLQTVGAIAIYYTLHI